MPQRLQTDRWLFLATLILCLLGAVMVFSASAVIAREQFGNAYSFILRQLLWLALGLAGMFWMMNVDYHRLRQPAVIFTGLFVVLVLLLGVFFFDRSHATHRWLRLGPASIQPSELAKLVVIFYLAWFLEMRRRPGSFGVNDLLHTLGPSLGPVLLFVGLVVMEPDLGTALELFLIALAVLFVAGLSGRYLLCAGAGALPVRSEERRVGKECRL